MSEIDDLRAENERLRADLTRATELRDYWHAETMSATRRIAEMHDDTAAAPSAPADAGLRNRIAQALLTSRRTDYEGTTDHRQHRYDARCALCAYDVDVLADAVLAVHPAHTDQTAEVAELRAELDYWRPDGGDGYGTPVHWTVYNDMHKRAAAAEAEATRMRAGWAGVMREAAMIAEGLRQFENVKGARKAAQVSENVGVLRVAAELRRVADEAQQAGEQPADAFAAASCPYGKGPGDGSGCIKPAGHDGDHIVTAGVPVDPCSRAVLHQPHMPHSWWPQPGMAYVHCPGRSFDTAN